MGQQPGTPVDVCNLALQACGQTTRITSILAPQTPLEDMGADWYDQTRREALREYIFNFARRPVTLYVGTPPIVDPQFATAYLLPLDQLRLLTIGDRLLYGGNTPTDFYNIADGWLYLDAAVTPDAADGVPIEYIYDAVTVAKFDPCFVEVLYLRLAQRFARPLKAPKSTRDDIVEALAKAELKAAAISGQEKPLRRVQRSRVRDVRRSGGIFRNNTIIGGS
jgi:hypothetical protein